MLTDFEQITWDELGGYVGTAKDVLSEHIINVYEEAVKNMNAIANDSNYQFLENIMGIRNNLVNQLQMALENGNRKRVYIKLEKIDLYILLQLQRLRDQIWQMIFVKTK